MLDLSKDTTIEKRYAIAMTITDQEGAEEYLEELVNLNMRKTNNSRITAEDIERSNIGYYAGYFDEKTRLRVEELFNCVHPALGAAKDGCPSPEECFKIGLRLGAQAKKAQEEGKPVDFHEYAQPEPRKKPIRKINWQEGE